MKVNFDIPVPAQLIHNLYEIDGIEIVGPIFKHELGFGFNANYETCALVMEIIRIWIDYKISEYNADTITQAYVAGWTHEANAAMND